MLADNPTWPKKKSEPEPVAEADHLDYLQAQGIPTTPPFPTQAQQAQPTTPITAKPCPFCGGLLSSMYVPPNPPMGSLGTPAQMTVGCHNASGCMMAPKVKCYSADLTHVIHIWNYRCP